MRSGRASEDCARCAGSSCRNVARSWTASMPSMDIRLATRSLFAMSATRRRMQNGASPDCCGAAVQAFGRWDEVVHGMTATDGSLYDVSANAGAFSTEFDVYC